MKHLFILLALALPVAAQQRTITISGNGRVQVAPDRVSFTVGVSTRSGSVLQAVRENNTKTAAVLAALKGRGVADTEIQTSNFTVEQPYEGGRQSSDYVVRNGVTVTRRERGNISDLLQAAIDAGANTAGGVRFFVADEGAARDRALEMAYRDARARAEKIATVAGRTLGDAITITTERPPTPPLVGGMGVAGGVAPPIESGMTTVNATLYVTFELK